VDRFYLPWHSFACSCLSLVLMCIMCDDTSLILFFFSYCILYSVFSVANGAVQWVNITVLSMAAAAVAVRMLPWSSASSLEQVANLLCAQANSISYPQRDRKWVVDYGLWGESLAWLVEAVICLVVVVVVVCVHYKSNCSLTREMDGHIMCCGYN